MKGKVLGYHQVSGDGVINGDDGNRYSFTRDQWKADAAPVPGRSVDFISDGSSATQIYVESNAVFTTFTGEKNRVIAALLAFFVGYLGFHKFYLGRNKEGVIMLVVFLLGLLLWIPSAIIALIAFVEAIIYISKSDADFDDLYVRGNKAWF